MSELTREVLFEGRRLALVRCYDGADGMTVVEAEVQRGGTEGLARRGPYRFATATEAFRFVQEALLALQYLGCTVATQAHVPSTATAA
jgi:hypothetical protein